MKKWLSRFFGRSKKKPNDKVLLPGVVIPNDWDNYCLTQYFDNLMQDTNDFIPQMMTVHFKYDFKEKEMIKINIKIEDL